MPINVGNNVGQWPNVVRIIEDGEAATEDVINRAPEDLTNRTLALRTFVELEEAKRDIEKAALDDFDLGHKHGGGADGAVLDLQQAYDNGEDISVIKLKDSGSITIKAQDDTVLLKIDNDTKKITGGNVIRASALDYGSAAGQVNQDVIPSGSVNSALPTATKALYDYHLTAVDNPHGHAYMGFPLNKSTLMNALGNSWVVTTEMTGESPDGGVDVEGVVADPTRNLVILKDHADDDFLDVDGNKVYGRIGYSAGIWTLFFYSNMDGVETAYSFDSPTKIKWWVQKIYAPHSRPVFSPMFEVASDQMAAMVNFMALTTGMSPLTDKLYDIGTLFKAWRTVFTEDTRVWRNAGSKSVTTWNSFNKTVGAGGEYAKLSEADLVDGDSVLVVGDYSLATYEVISANDVRIAFMPGKKITSSGTTGTLVITGENVKLEDPAIDIDVGVGNTQDVAIRVEGGHGCVVDNMRITGVSGILTTAIQVGTGTTLVSASGSVLSLGGTISNKYVDQGTDSEFRIRGLGEAT